MKIERTSGKLRHTVGPYSRRLQRGGLAYLDGRSVEGRHARALEAELVATITGPISVTDRLLIDRLIRLRLHLDRLERKMDAAWDGKEGSWTEHDAWAYSAAGNQYRLTLHELRALPGEKTRKRGRQPFASLLAEMAPR